MKVTGTLPIGIEVDGILHRDFELRGATVMDNIEVTEELIERDEVANQLRVGTAMMARQLLRLGTLRKDQDPDKNQITTDLVRTLHTADWNHLDRESEALEKKLLSGGQTPPPTGGSTSSPGAQPETSTRATSTA